MMMQQKAFIGRTFTPIKDHRTKKITYQLDPKERVEIDFTRKQHTFIIAKSGGGKSYLAGVYAEELVRVMENYAVVILDPMGIFSTLNMPNSNYTELEAWNTQVPGDIRASPVNRCKIWVPAGDADQFLPGTYDRKFAMRAHEFSHGTLCYAFDLDPLEPQVNLYRKSQHGLVSHGERTYSLGRLVTYIRENGHEMGFQTQTVEALVTKLDALAELGIIAEDGPAIHEIIRDQEVAVFDLSLSSTYTAKILVNFFAERLLLLRRQITRMVTEAKVRETQIGKPEWYIPPVQFVLDEAHNFIPRSPILKKCVKEGRNCGFMMTAISQSPDLTRDVYTNISHIFVGPLVYDEDIAAVKSMLPISQSPKEFKSRVHALTTGTFLYYNIDEKTETLLRVRPRSTLHPASTELRDERKYFKSTSGTSEPLSLKPRLVGRFINGVEG